MKCRLAAVILSIARYLEPLVPPSPNPHYRPKFLTTHLPWPAPALLVWLLGWLVFVLSQPLIGGLPALLLACSLGVVLSVCAERWWRRLMIAAGFPLSLALTLSISGVAMVPTWAWLLVVAVLLLVYPLNAWRDAPLFPTPALALRELPRHAPLAPGASVLDAGCGLGHGLVALRAAYPHARLHGVEWSWLLRWACALRCPWAHIRRGDLWRGDWRDVDLVYLFQRPESMARATDKAIAELRAGAWLVSLAFEAEALQATAVIRGDNGHPVWLYRAPLVLRQEVLPQPKPQ